MAEKKYREVSYAAWMEPSKRSAEAVVPLVVEWFRPQSIIDVGCGLGMWARTFGEHGVPTAHGIDGHSVPTSDLLIPASDFTAVDLTRGVDLDRTYDLVVSLEVGEHLPAEAALTFVKSLTRLGSVVLFSAAIPLQGGAHHVNERWPDYWARMFAAQGYRPVDALRRSIWTDESVAPYYCQNMMLYIREDRLPEWPDLEQDVLAPGEMPLSLIHPHYYLSRSPYQATSLRWWAERTRYYFFAVLRRLGLTDRV